MSRKTTIVFPSIGQRGPSPSVPETRAGSSRGRDRIRDLAAQHHDSLASTYSNANFVGVDVGDVPPAAGGIESDPVSAAGLQSRLEFPELKGDGAALSNRRKDDRCFLDMFVPELRRRCSTQSRTRRRHEI